MRKSKFTESQIMAILKQNEAGVPVPGYAVSMVLAQLRSTSGAQNMVAWTLRS